MRNTDTIGTIWARHQAEKQAHPEVLLLHEVGDFYELLNEDALVAAPLLASPVAHRTFADGTRVLMCGVFRKSLGRASRLLRAAGHDCWVLTADPQGGHEDHS